MKKLSWILCLASICLAGACTPPGSPAECEAIVERCHPLDPGTGPIHECHEYAEASGRTAAECSARQTECFAACVSTDAGTDAAPTDVSTTDAAATE